MRTIALALALAAAALAPRSPAAADDRRQLFKCVDAAGTTSIQSHPCASGSTTVWRRDATPEAPPSPAESAESAARTRRDQQRVRELSEEVERKLNPRAPASPEPLAPLPEPAAEPELGSSVNPELAACQDAQAFANAVREKEWLGLSDEQLRRLYAWVAQQCRVSSPG